MIKKLLIILLLVFCGVASADSPRVYICLGGMSECFHKTPNCKGLERCSTDIKAISLDEAKKMGRRSCKWCYGNN